MKKSESEIDLMRRTYPNVPDFALPKTRKSKSPANELTYQIILFIQSIGGFASRVNSQGNYNPTLKLFTFSGSTKGAADVSTCIGGRNIQIEVKIGRDRQSPAQVKFQASIEAAGGCYIIARTFEQFREDFEEIISNIK